MNYEFTNIRDFKIMYLGTMIAETMQLELDKFDIIKEYYSNNNLFKYIKSINMYLYNFLISIYGGITNFNISINDFENSLYLQINEIIYDNLDNNQNIQKYIDKQLNLLETSKEKKKYILYNKFYLNSTNFLIKKGMKDEYYSLIYLSVPFALKISDKKLLIKSLQEFILRYTNDINQILSTITCALFINYALNNIGINIWIDKLNEDLKDLDGSEKYLDYINNYAENNFRNGEFVIRAIDQITVERNKNFINNYCSRNNRLLSEKPQEQVLLIYDTLLRSKENWEKLVLFGFCNWNDNPIISIVLSLLYEILYKSSKINKNLLKRFSFNL